ncbi:transposase [Nocardiopsis sp. NRRL B-16309]|uniref:transposase n=1 Tax=Nocardiopsis sp. NRRL B-16309 TaxID=1519494 RepID=UPI0009EB4220|nr:transposase [Nocardiopsis sp. NRRL B-16309]
MRDEPDGSEALGRSRGGLTTKIHLLADQHRRPLVLATTPGQPGDSPMFEPLMGALRLPRSTGRPRTRPDRVLGDKAYSSRANRDHLRKRKIKATIAQPRDQREHRRRKGSAGGRPPAFDQTAYRHRNTVECLVPGVMEALVCPAFFGVGFLDPGTT